MSLSELIRSRHSIRDFADKEVPQALLHDIIETALCSPSSSNTQAYRIAVATGETRDQLAQELSERFSQASRVRRLPIHKKLWHAVTGNVMPDGDYKVDTSYPAELKKRASECGMGLYQALGITRDDYARRDQQMARNFEFFNAPVALFVFVHGQRDVYSPLDAGIFMQSLMLAAHDKGLGCCAQAALAIWAGPVKQHFTIDKDYKLICGISLGYPSDHVVNGYQPPKRSVEEICFPER